MDYKVKGISWVGNAFQKFEAMCLEVEDVVCQETAKYVGTQVQTVGSSVKKFYAEVLQDLLPPSSLDTKNPEGSDLLLEDFGTYEKPKLSVEEDSVEVNSYTGDNSEKSITTVKSLCQEQTDEVETCKRSKPGTEKYSLNKKLVPVEMSHVITSSGKISSQASLRSRVHSKNHLLSPLSVNPVIAVESRLPLKDNDSDEMCQKSHTPTDTGSVMENLALPCVAPVGKNISQASSSPSAVKADHAKACGTETRMTSAISLDIVTCDSHKNTGTSCNSRLVETVCSSDISSSSQSSSLVLPVVSSEKKVAENGLSTFGGILTESNVVDTSATSNSISQIGSSRNVTEQFSEDDDHSEMDNDDEIVELSPETIDDEYRNMKLDESCIVVDSNDLPFPPYHGAKHKSYKKKIRDALASRMRIAKKQEYEQLAIWHESSNNPPLLAGNLKKSSSQDNGESEWELL